MCQKMTNNGNNDSNNSNKTDKECQKSRPLQPMHDAAKEGDLERIKNLVKEGYPIHTEMGEYWTTPLWLAAQGIIFILLFLSSFFLSSSLLFFLSSFSASLLFFSFLFFSCFLLLYLFLRTALYRTIIGRNPHSIAVNDIIIILIIIIKKEDTQK